MSNKIASGRHDETDSANAIEHSEALCIHNTSTLGEPLFDALAEAWLAHQTSLEKYPFDIVVLGQRLEECILVDIQDAHSAVFRFVGPAICKRLQGDPTGLDLLLLIESFPFDVSRILHEMISKPVGLHAVYEMSYKSGRKAVNQGFYLPLIATDGRADQIIGMQSAGSTVMYDTEPSQAVVATKLIALTWVDVGVGVPTQPPQFEAG